MKIHWILKSIGLILVILFFSYLNLPKQVSNKDKDNKNLDIKTKEGFTNHSYNECINQGYTKEFCVQTPVSVLGPGYCLCRNGLLGFREPGFQGRCLCADDDVQIY